ncbi:MAG: hypothetical protein KatS3mg031_2221 [Chitinophagales bacterium]|nr:MAG: hypothetical protein KatS3mg031_2221 [Chitinophagales bacterium]
MPVKNYYKILGLPSTATQEEIKATYRKLVRKYHPDRNRGYAEKFKLIQEAYEVLCDERKRNHFDAQLAYETYLSNPVELAKFLKDQKNKPKKYKPPVVEQEPEPEKRIAFNSTSALIGLIILLVAAANVFIIRMGTQSETTPEKSVSHNQYAAGMSDQQLAEEYIQRARMLMREKNTELAKVYFNKAAELSPHNPDVYFHRGLLHYLLKDYQAALADLNKTLRLSPSYKNGHWVRAKIKYDMDDNRGAIADFTEAIKYDPYNDSLYFNRGLAYYYLNDFEAAIRDIDRAIELNPRQPQYYYDRGDAKEMAGDEEGTCSDWMKAKEMGYVTPDFGKKKCLDIASSPS